MKGEQINKGRKEGRKEERREGRREGGRKEGGRKRWILNFHLTIWLVSNSLYEWDWENKCKMVRVILLGLCCSSQWTGFLVARWCYIRLGSRVRKEEGKRWWHSNQTNTTSAERLLKKKTCLQIAFKVWELFLFWVGRVFHSSGAQTENDLSPYDLALDTETINKLLGLKPATHRQFYTPIVGVRSTVTAIFADCITANIWSEFLRLSWLDHWEP